ncbi:MAG TPA: hypothetical protein VM305_04655 [Candidatus Limnocylindrales bacterium]|nr:hypothetical protein [Candidatus Limnocylindrales bacterium]
MSRLTRLRISVGVLAVSLLVATSLGAPSGRAAAAYTETASTPAVQNQLVGVGVTVSGKVTAYVKATAAANGSITIGGVAYKIKAGTSMPSHLKVGVWAQLRISLNLNGLIVGCTLVSLKLTASGTVTAYTKATASTNGSITIGGVAYKIKAGVSLPAGVKVGAWVKLNLTLNGSGLITACALVSAKVAVSGLITAYVKATATSNGSITVGGQTFKIKAGVSLPAYVKVGVNLKADLLLNAAGLVTGCNVLSIVAGDLTLQGKVTAYVKATATTAGSITIGGVKLKIKAGVTLPAGVQLGAVVNVNLKVSSGAITGCTLAGATVSASGLVTAYVKATATTTGSITIGGKVYKIKAGVSLPAAVKVGVNVSLKLRLNTAGLVDLCTFVSAHVTVSGKVSAYVPATLLTAGSITVGGQTFKIKAGVSLPLTVVVGVNVKLRLTLNAAGAVTACKLI